MWSTTQRETVGVLRNSYREPGTGAGAPPAPAVAVARRDGRDRLLSTLSRHGALSRAELARRAVLAPSTVSSIVAELLAAGLVVEVKGATVSAPGGRGGRPAVQVALHRRAGVALGIDVGKRHIRVALADLAHELLAERAVAAAADAPAGEGIEQTVALVDEVLAQAGAQRGDVIGVGMGLPGPVRSTSGELGHSTILPGWIGVRAPQAMTEALGLPVRVDNDANLGALGEWTWGAARGCDDVTYLKVATGIGAGLIIGGRPYAGFGGTAGELGHLVIDPGGPICRCGNRGCLEMLAGVDAVLAGLRLTHGTDLTIREVIRLGRDGDAGCRRALADAGRTIGTALGAFCNLLNPARVVVGGELGSAGDLLLPAIRESLDRGVIRSAGEDVTVVEGALGDRAEVLGALALAVRSGSPLTASTDQPGREAPTPA